MTTLIIICLKIMKVLSTSLKNQYSLQFHGKI